MKLTLNLAFFLTCFFSFAQESSKTLNVAKINTGIYGDEIVRTITAGKQGATIRFVDPRFGSAFWNEDSLILAVINYYELDSLSNAHEIAVGVADFIKMQKVQQHAAGYPNIKNVEGKNNFFSSYLYLSSVANINNGDFAVQFAKLGNSVSRQLGIEYKVSLVRFENYVGNEFFDKDLEKWIYVDVDPKSPVFFPKKNGRFVSANELIQEPEILLDASGEFRSIMGAEPADITRNIAYQNMKRWIDNTNKLDITPVEKGIEAFDFYYRLLPGQTLTWSYTVDALFLNYEECSSNFDMLFEVLNNDGDSLDIINSLIGVAECYNVDHELVISKIAGERGLFASETYFGKDVLRLNSFQTEIPKGSYVKEDLYIPHLLKSIKNGSPFLGKSKGPGADYNLDLYILDDEEQEPPKSISSENLYDLTKGMKLFDDKCEIEFYSNDYLSFKTNEQTEIVILEGDITLKHQVNEKVVFETTSIE